MNKTPVENKSQKGQTELTLRKGSNESLMSSGQNNVEFEVLPTPVKSDNDKKEYKVIRLKNGLTACLISDQKPTQDVGLSKGNHEDENGHESSEKCADENKEQKMAATSLCIGVGSFSDPKDIPGMAHFLEHMVFMGSEKFPQENDFSSFISKRGGLDNASTDCSVTTFYFQCLERDLFTALDKFAQFFISPLMKKGSIAREREAVDSEFQMALPADSYRKEQLLLSLAKSDTPVNFFPWGNLTTLRDNISEDELYSGLHTFRKRHYSAHRMTLAIQGRLPLDVLQSYVLECFNNVPCNNLPPRDFSHCKDMFDTTQFRKMYYIQPMNDLIQLDLAWALPPLLDKYKSRPSGAVSFLIGHKGKGSLLSYLKKKVWVLGLTAGTGQYGSESNSMYAIFAIYMTLTKEGLEHLFEVIEIVFSYINMLRKIGPQERIFQEIKTITDTSFKFAAEGKAVEVVTEMSENMQLYPPEDYITGSNLLFDYDPESIEMVLNCLTPDKMNISVLCNKNNLQPGLNFDKTEKWFGTKYSKQDIPEQWLKKWQEASPLREFALPSSNIFLTEDFTILQEDEQHPKYPEKILSTDLVELWYRKDQKFKLPIAYYNFYFINPVAIQTPKSAALLDIYMNLLDILLSEEGYPAEVAHLSYTFDAYDKGLTMGVAGYNQKLHVLIEMITKHFLNFGDILTQEMFDAMKDKLIKGYYNYLLDPSDLAEELRLYILIDNYKTSLEKYMVASSITMEDVKAFSREFVNNLFIKVLVQGNVARDHANNVVNNLITTLKCQPLPPDTYPNFRVTQVPTGETFCVVESFNKNDCNSDITNYYQCGPDTTKDSMIIELLMMILEEPLFDTLRTKEQLGYSVNCCGTNTFGITGFTITVVAQATKNSTDYVEKRIEIFVKQASDILADMSEQSFEDTKKDLIKTKRCSDVDLSNEVSRNWTEIAEEFYIFDRTEKEIAELENIKLSDVQQWWETHTRGGNEENFRKLSVQVVGFKHSDNFSEKETENNLVTQDDKNEEVKLQLNFIDSVRNETENEEKERLFVEDVHTFKETLFLYPLACGFTMHN
ncbi:nardilysin-like isoform X1 [Zophobas morio]|uniref:nardilysin-like isoform X1 n=1 Tax=Zophobas morio TaxID=2755281 RepID=UPI0030835A21